MQKIELNITSVEISLTDLCNRKCSFCPQVFSEFQNLYENKFIKFETLINIKKELDKFDTKPLISLAGFGEPLLYKKIIDVIELFKDYEIIIFTNVDNKNKLLKIDKKNVFVFANLYDEEKEEEYLHILKKLNHSKYYIVKHWLANKDRYQNRNKIFNDLGKEEDKVLPCQQPYTNVMIDHLGNVILCCNDWYRSNIFGNVNENSLFEILSGDYAKIANDILKNRMNYEFCNGCNYKSNKSLKEFYNSISNSLSA